MVFEAARRGAPRLIRPRPRARADARWRRKRLPEPSTLATGRAPPVRLAPTRAGAALHAGFSPIRERRDVERMRSVRTRRLRGPGRVRPARRAIPRAAACPSPSVGSGRAGCATRGAVLVRLAAAITQAAAPRMRNRRCRRPARQAPRQPEQPGYSCPRPRDHQPR